MALTPLKKEFSRKLRSLVKGSGVRQLELASRLELTPSAVSQMLHGKIVPDSDRLTSMLAYIEAPAEDSDALHYLLRNIRSGVTVFRSDLNSRLFSCRCRRGLSHYQLSLRIGIPASKLRAYEDNPDCQPSDEDMRKLKDIFGDRLIPGDEQVMDVDEGAPEAGENSFSYELPVLCLTDFDDYDETVGLAELAAAKSRSSVLGDWAQVDTPVVVMTDGVKLGLTFPGMVKLVLGASRPLGFFELDLICCRNGYLLRQNVGDGRIPLLGSDCAAGEILWTLPVLELSFRPILAERGV